MSNAIETSKTFQERMFERIREQMGDLMTDDDLKKIVETAMQKAFFEERITFDSYNRSTTAPPVFVELIRKQLEEQVAGAVRDWLRANHDEVVKQIDAAIAKGMFGLVRQHMEQAIQHPLWDFAQNLRNSGLLK
jgi:hypothetical protein